MIEQDRERGDWRYTVKRKKKVVRYIAFVFIDFIF